MTTKNDNIPPKITQIMVDLLLLIAKGTKTGARLSRKTGRNRSNVCRDLKKLIERGLLNQDPTTKGYSITQKSGQFLLEYMDGQHMTTKSSTTPSMDNTLDNMYSERTYKRKKYKIRSENIALLFRIKSLPSDWNERRKKILFKRDIKYSTSELKNHNIYSHPIDHVMARTTTRGIMIHVPELMGQAPTEAWAKILLMLPKVIGSIERMYNIRLQNEFKVIAQEHADLQHLVADYKEKIDGGKYWIYKNPDDGKPRWKIDKSKGFAEFETMHASFAEDDMETLGHYFKDVADHPNTPKPSEMAVQIEQLQYQTVQVADIHKNGAKAIHNQYLVNEQVTKHFQDVDAVVKMLVHSQKLTQEQLKSLALLMNTLLPNANKNINSESPPPSDGGPPGYVL